MAASQRENPRPDGALVADLPHTPPRTLVVIPRASSSASSSLDCCGCCRVGAAAGETYGPRRVVDSATNASSSWMPALLLNVPSPWGTLDRATSRNASADGTDACLSKMSKSSTSQGIYRYTPLHERAQALSLFYYLYTKSLRRLVSCYAQSNLYVPPHVPRIAIISLGVLQYCNTVVAPSPPSTPCTQGCIKL